MNGHCILVLPVALFSLIKREEDKQTSLTSLCKYVANFEKTDS